MIELKVPSVGESITEVQVGEWLVGEGQGAAADEVVVVIETDKVTVELPAPRAGTVSKVLKAQGESATVGEVIGYLDESQRPAATEPAVATVRAPASASGAADPKVMPAARRVLGEAGLEASGVEGTGPGGRILKEDAARHIAVGSSPAEPIGSGPIREDASRFREEEVVPLTPIRLRIAERLVEAQQQAALLTTFNEIDMSAVKSLRKRVQESFVARHDTKLGFMSFFVKATIEALKEIPRLNALMEGDSIRYRNYYDVGIAVGGGKGLVVPVLRNAERLSFAEVEKGIGDFARRAQANTLKLDELTGGTFTISNGGVYGSLLSTPIVNPPQSGILGLHAIQDRPVAVNGEVVVRPMMYVALTYDHRIVDGREAVTFLRRVKDCVEDPQRILLEV